LKNQYSLGIVFVVVSAIVFSSAGLFTKGIEAEAWGIIFWRGIFAAGFTTLFVMIRGTVSAEFNNMGGVGLVVAIVGASGTAAFIPAFKFTSIANVSLIYAIAPLLAAILAWVWFRERPSLAVIVGALVAFLGVVTIFNGSFGSVNLTGDLLALWMTLSMAMMLVIYRRHPNTPAAGPAALSSILLLPPALVFGVPFQMTSQEIAITACFGLVFIGSAIRSHFGLDCFE